ncbi:anthranilate/para-aminobenzoate synthase component I [Thermanaerovibrio velox DSM 12556]|uniref:Anthranilate synthase component 1 n=1 Tax=Thermanaerovibrio velox DSM 12556 TaxID=926567 RepID=H0UP97_9BACT|nr:anthranilate synthase component I family protein [Thermanaerovibrio velox]EHM09510.1 anthranilate/para-aminobenzoate synthase component I [Thermanaerovibrio velox DSM 12556]
MGVHEIRGRENLTSLEDFIRLCSEFERVPVIMELSLQGRDPLMIYESLKRSPQGSFLMETPDPQGRWGRYSFIGTEPDRIFTFSNNICIETSPQGRTLAEFPGRDGLKKALGNYLAGTYPPVRDDLPPFLGGAAGYFAYDIISAWEDLFHRNEGKALPCSHLPMASLMGFSSVIAIDHLGDKLFLVVNQHIPRDMGKEGLEGLYRMACLKLEGLRGFLESYLDHKMPQGTSFFLNPLKPLMTKEDFLDMVRKGREHIIAGDICQVVLSQRFSAKTNLPATLIYRALKACNPSPYHFLLELPNITLIGSSPELHVKLAGSKAVTRPLAGTRRRGDTEEEDRRAALELLGNEKERAEHIMLVDLARNDLGRICQPGSVRVTELMGIEQYSQVMHIVSQVEGQKRPEATPLDLLISSFPAGTVSGAPKIRAMEIIGELEGTPRGPYAGAVGYLGFQGSMDTCITIRTIVKEDDRVHIQAGAGVVYDSDPEMEYQETLSKAGAMFKAMKRALQMAAKGEGTR